MPHGQPVVIRSSWRAALVANSPVLLILVGSQLLQGNWVVAPVMAVAIILVSALVRLIYRVELSEQGLEILWFRRQVVPWQHIGSVASQDRWGAQYVSVSDVHTNRRRMLPAPRGTLGVGRDEVETARQVIEKWWVTYRGDFPVPPLQPREFVPGSDDDPYAPPPSG